MIHGRNLLSNASAVPQTGSRADDAVYFDPRLRIVTAEAMRRDAKPIDALEQMFGYFER